MLAIYGEPFTELAGTGIIRHNQNSEVKINFACVQLHNGEIFLHAWSDSNYISEFRAIDTHTRINSISGTLNDDRNFIAEGDILFMRGAISMPPKEKDGIVFRLSTFTTICAPDLIDESVSSVRFYLANLRFIGTECFQAKDGSRKLYLPLDISDRKVKIFPVVNYSSEERFVTATKISRVTSFIEISASECHQYSDVVSMVNNLCYLLTLTSGTKINWVSFANVNLEGQIIKSDHRNAIVWKYSGLPAISDSASASNNRNVLKEFLEKSYERFLTLKEKYLLHETIDAIAQAKLGDSYLELRGTLVVSAIDVLRGRWANEHERTTIFDEATFEAKKQKLENMVSKCAEKKFTATAPQRKEVREKVAELNRPSFASILNAMCADLGVEPSPDALRIFKKNRNSLVHSARFIENSTGDRKDEFWRILGFADLLLLGILGYPSQTLAWAEAIGKTYLFQNPE